MGGEPLQPRQLIVGDESRGGRSDKRGEEHVEMEQRLGGGPAAVGRDADVDGRRVDVRRECRLLEEFSSSGRAEAGVVRVQVPTERAPPPVAAMAGEQHQPTGLDDEHAGHQMGAITMTGIEERQCVGPRGLTASGRSSNREECSRRVPLIGGAAHTHDGIDGAPVSHRSTAKNHLQNLWPITRGEPPVQRCRTVKPGLRHENLII